MRVLLLGGSGLIGGATARALLAAGHAVTVLSRGSRPPIEGTEALIADRRDTDSLSRALEGQRFDFTVDLTAYDAADIERLLLVPYAALGRYAMISTGQVYLVTQSTHVPYREADSEMPLISEPPADSDEHPGWVYGVGKRRAESAVLALRVSHGVRAMVLRLPIVIGEGDSTGRLWAYLERLLDGGPILLPDGGQKQLRFIWSGDVARALVESIDRPAPREAVYNLAQPEIITLRELLEIAAQAAGVGRARFVDATWSEIGEAGIDRWFSPFSGKWVSLLDPGLAAAALGFIGTRMSEYLPGVVRWNLEHRPEKSHPGYAEREKERALAARLEQPAR
jgi:nucleoside-diphosphate-sugar epimerase